MFFSQDPLCCLPARDNRFQEQFFLIFDVRNEIDIIIDDENHNALTGIFLLIGVQIVIHDLTVIKVKNQILETDPLCFFKPLALFAIPINAFHQSTTYHIVCILATKSSDRAKRVTHGFGEPQD
jgi:hypothetical protein